MTLYDVCSERYHAECTGLLENIRDMNVVMPHLKVDYIYLIHVSHHYSITLASTFRELHDNCTAVQ